MTLVRIREKMKVKERFEEQVFFTTTRITIPQTNGKGTSIGTGFLMRVPLNDGTNSTITLLISNKHVFQNPNGTISFNFNKKKPDLNPDLGNLHTFTGKDFTGIYTEHPNPEIDLACINASVITHEENNVYFTYLQPKMISDFTEDNFIPGLDVWFVGYPANRFDVSNNLPLLRKGYVSSIPKVNFNAKDQFVIDAQVYQGSSGSPVFSGINGKFKLIGVVTQTMIRHGILQTIPTLQNGLGVEQTLGLGIVLKATLLNELIDAAVAKVIAGLPNSAEPLTEEEE
ncbi:serine protease [uncultured Aquimarina sp.]|uniref:S1 family peptidase n=1 Tax=uncultured Aquimarina sp. TaxID=575652 RepID=UPI002636D60A|nr:serine protease [uncultured Aquimarina sp.]